MALIERKDIAHQLLSMVFGLITTAFGFFIAIYLNNVVEQGEENETFLTIKKSIEAEMEENKIILDSSFHKYIDGVIFNELSTVSSVEYLTNSIFLERASPQLLIAFQNYIQLVQLCNRQKNELKNSRMNGGREEWDNLLQAYLLKTIRRTKNSMQTLKEQLNH